MEYYFEVILMLVLLPFSLLCFRGGILLEALYRIYVGYKYNNSEQENNFGST
jgi:hypothetical protein